MLHMELDLSGFRKLADETLRQIQRDATEAVREGLNTAAEYAKGHHQHTRRTGYLTSDAIHTRIETIGPRGVIGELINDAPYAGFVEYGTKPHRIEAKAGGVLAFEVSTPTVHGFGLNAETVFAKYVNHPGTSPMPFMHPAAEVGINDVRRRMIEKLRVTAALWK
jgi:HK97 gp10 family phage protein